ncbi:MAG: Amuc_1102 family pilus-like protein [Verrucomicrobiales bacterium]
MRIFVILAAVSALLPSLSWGQSNKVRIQQMKVVAEMQKTPNYVAEGPKAKQIEKPREWLEIEVEFTAEPAKDLGPVIPRLEFRYYLLVKDLDKKPRMLTGTVMHVNVTGNQKLYSVIYVDPDALTKLTGDPGKFKTRDVEEIGVVALYDGIQCGEYASGGKKFWESPNAASATMPGMILNKNQTPFSLLWKDRYPEIEQAAAR